MRRFAVLFALVVAVPCFSDDRWDRWGDRNREGAGRYNNSILPQNVTIDPGFQRRPIDNTPNYGERKQFAKQEESAALDRTLILAAAVVGGAAILGLILRGRKHDSIHHPRPTDGVPESGRDPDQGVGDQGESPLRPVSGADVHPQVGDP